MNSNASYHELDLGVRIQDQESQMLVKLVKSGHGVESHYPA